MRQPAATICVMTILLVGCSPQPTPTALGTAIATPSTPAPATSAPVNAAPSIESSTPASAGWQPVTAQDSVTGTQFQAVAWTGTRFVATGIALGGEGVFLDSPDGLSWHRQESAIKAAYPSRIAAGPLGLVAIGTIGDRLASWASPDGLRWTARRDAFPATPTGADSRSPTSSAPPMAGSPSDARTPSATSTAPSSRSDRVWTSVDGLHWTGVAKQRSLVGAGMNGVAAGGPGFVAAGAARGRAALWTSAEGRWSRVPDDAMFHPQPGSDPGAWVAAVEVAAGRASRWSSAGRMASARAANPRSSRGGHQTGEHGRPRRSSSASADRSSASPRHLQGSSRRAPPGSRAAWAASGGRSTGRHGTASLPIPPLPASGPTRPRERRRPRSPWASPRPAGNPRTGCRVRSGGGPSRSRGIQRAPIARVRRPVGPGGCRLCRRGGFASADAERNPIPCIRTVLRADRRPVLRNVHGADDGPRRPLRARRPDLGIRPRPHVTQRHPGPRHRATGLGPRHRARVRSRVPAAPGRDPGAGGARPSGRCDGRLRRSQPAELPPATALRIEDPDGFYRSVAIGNGVGSCASASLDYVEGARGKVVGPIRQSRDMLRGLRAGDVVERAGYATDKGSVRVVRVRQGDRRPDLRRRRPWRMAALGIHPVCQPGHQVGNAPTTLSRWSRQARSRRAGARDDASPVPPRAASARRASHTR